MPKINKARIFFKPPPLPLGYRGDDYQPPFEKLSHNLNFGRQFGPKIDKNSNINSIKSDNSQFGVVYIIIGSGYCSEQEYDNETILGIAKSDGVYILSIDIEEPKKHGNLPKNIFLDRSKYKADLEKLSDDDYVFFASKFECIKKKFDNNFITITHVVICNSISMWSSQPSFDQILEIANDYLKTNTTNLFKYVTPNSTSSATLKYRLQEPIIKYMDEDYILTNIINCSPKVKKFFEQILKKNIPVAIFYESTNGAILEGGNTFCNEFLIKMNATQFDKDFFNTVMEKIYSLIMRSDVDESLNQLF